MVNNTCLNCHKYVFDKQNVKVKRMSAEEYIESVIRNTIRVNLTSQAIIKKLKLDGNLFVNLSECELCGAPHAVWSHPVEETVKLITFFYSGTNKHSEADKAFIRDFRSSFLSR